MSQRWLISDDTPCSDALWDAFRYLANELPPEELAAFEERLLHDPDVADSLAQASELWFGLVGDRAPQSDSVVRSPRSLIVSNRRIVWVCLSVCSAVLLLIGWSVNRQWDDGLFPTSGLSGLSDLTSNKRAGSSVVKLTPQEQSMLSVWVELNARGERLLEEPLSEGGLEPALEDDVPDWMFAALAAPGASLEGLERHPAPFWGSEEESL